MCMRAEANDWKMFTENFFGAIERERKFSMLSLFDYFIELLMEIYINLFQLNLLLRRFSVKSQLGNDGKHEEEKKKFFV